MKSAYRKYSTVPTSRGLTGKIVAEEILHQAGIFDVPVEITGGELSDHYDPRTNVIRLSDGVFNSTSVAAVGIACHEAGHAAQHAQGYLPIKIRNTILPVCNIGSYAGIPLAILGVFLNYSPLITLGILLYAFVAIFQLVTLPVEFDASHRAVVVMDETGMLGGDELEGAKKVLKAAAMTYVASLAVSLANLLRFIIRFSGRRR